MSSKSTLTDPPLTAAPQAVRLVLIDRDALARRAMREEITASGEFVVAAEADAESDAIEVVRREVPDLVLIDIGYPHLEGIAIAREIRRQLPDTRMVFCSITDDEDTAVKALRAGAVGFVSKDLEIGPLTRALQGALVGEAAITRQLGMRLIDELYRQSEPGPRLRPAGGELTAREWQVLDLLIDGAGTTDIAESLGLAVETVRSHIKHVLRKLGVRTRQEAVEIARRLRGRIG
ncbi:MAG TPA: response regulator transcription factor [Solirubrobacteraceae bacterium]|jgi:DNA-binding NarL/FixJ family response regulator